MEWKNRFAITPYTFHIEQTTHPLALMVGRGGIAAFVPRPRSGLRSAPAPPEVVAARYSLAAPLDFGRRSLRSLPFIRDTMGRGGIEPPTNWL